MKARGHPDSRTHPLQQAIEILNRTEQGRLVGVSPHSRPYVATWLAQQIAPRPLLWIVADDAEAEELYHASKFFLPDPERTGEDPFAARTALFPLPQLVPYEEISPDRYLVADRLSLLARLLEGRPPTLLITSLSSLMRLNTPREAIRGACRLVQRDQEVDRQALLAQLQRSGYLNVPLVEDPGT